MSDDYKHGQEIGAIKQKVEDIDIRLEKFYLEFTAMREEIKEIVHWKIKVVTMTSVISAVIGFVAANIKVIFHKII